MCRSRAQAKMATVRGPESTRECEIIPQPRDAVNDMVLHPQRVILRVSAALLRSCASPSWGTDRLVRSHKRVSTY